MYASRRFWIHVKYQTLQHLEDKQRLSCLDHFSRVPRQTTFRWCGCYAQWRRGKMTKLTWVPTETHSSTANGCLKWSLSLACSHPQRHHRAVFHLDLLSTQTRLTFCLFLLLQWFTGSHPRDPEDLEATTCFENFFGAKLSHGRGKRTHGSGSEEVQGSKWVRAKVFSVLWVINQFKTTKLVSVLSSVLG